MTKDILDERTMARYFSALLAVIIIGLAAVGTMLLISIHLFSFTNALHRISLDLIIRRGLPLLRDGALVNGVGLAAMLLIVPLLRMRQPGRRHYWFLILLCFAANAIMVTLLALVLTDAENAKWLAMWTIVTMLLATIFGVFFLPLQRVLEWIFGLFRRQGGVKVPRRF